MRLTVHIAAVLFLLSSSLPLIAQEADKAANESDLEARAAAMQKQLQEYQKVIAEGHQSLVEFGGIDGARQQAVELQQRKNELQFERVVLEARRGAMEKQIARLAVKVREALAEDKLLTIMRDALAEQSRRREELVKDRALAAAEARAASLSEQIQLAERANEVAKQAGQEIINRLNGELVDMEIREAELAARERHTEELRAQSRRNVETARKIQLMESQAHQLRLQLSMERFNSSEGLNRQPQQPEEPQN